MAPSPMMHTTSRPGSATAAPSACATPAPSIPNLKVDSSVFGTAHLVIEHGPDGGVAAVGHEDGVVGKEFAAHLRRHAPDSSAPSGRRAPGPSARRSRCMVSCSARCFSCARRYGFRLSSPPAVRQAQRGTVWHRRGWRGRRACSCRSFRRPHRPGSFSAWTEDSSRAPCPTSRSRRSACPAPAPGRRRCARCGSV